MTTNDGLPSNEISGIHVMGDTCLIGTKAGFSTFRWPPVTKSKGGVPVLWKAFETHEDTMTIESGQTIEVPWNLPYISIKYLGLDFKAEGKSDIVIA